MSLMNPNLCMVLQSINSHLEEVNFKLLSHTSYIIANALRQSITVCRWPLSRVEGCLTAFFPANMAVPIYRSHMPHLVTIQGKKS